MPTRMHRTRRRTQLRIDILYAASVLLTDSVRLNEGDPFAALLWFAEPMVRDPQNAQTEMLARSRLGAFRRQVPLPVLVQMKCGSVRTISPDGKLAVIHSNDTSVWDISAGKALCKLRAPAYNHVTFSADGSRIVSEDPRGNYRKVNVWNASTGELAGPSLSLPNRLNKLAISPDGSWVVTLSGFQETAKLQLWNVAAGEPFDLQMGSKEKEVITNLTFSPDGQSIAVVGSASGSFVRLLDVKTRTARPLTAPELQTGSFPQHATFSPDSRFLLAGILWDTTTGKPAGSSLTGGTFAVFSPDGNKVLVRVEAHIIEIRYKTTGKLVRAPTCPSSRSRKCGV